MLNREDAVVFLGDPSDRFVVVSVHGGIQPPGTTFFEGMNQAGQPASLVRRGQGWIQGVTATAW